MWKRTKTKLTPEQAEKREAKMAERSNMAKNIGIVRQETRNMGTYLYVRYRRLYIYGGSVVALNSAGVIYLVGHVLGAW